MRHVSVLIASASVAVATGCTTVTDLSSLADVELRVYGTRHSNGTESVFVDLEYEGASDECSTFDIEATLNGTPFDKIREGGQRDDCMVPHASIHRASLPADVMIVIGDESATFEVAIPQLMGHRTIEVPPTTVRSGEVLALATSILPGDALSSGWMMADVIDATCTDSRVLNETLPTSVDGYRYTVPDLTMRRACSEHLTAGVAFTADLAITMKVTPEIVGCHGVASCWAVWKESTTTRATVIP